MIFKRNNTLTDADSRIQELMKLEELRISGHPPPFQLKTEELGVQYDVSPNPCRIMAAEVGVQYDFSPNPCTKMNTEAGTQYDFSDACFDKVVARKLVSPTRSEKEHNDHNFTFSISTDRHTQKDMAELIFPPVLCRMTAGKCDPYGFLTLTKEADYDSDNTCDIFVECGEKGIGKCRKMQGRESYEYYEHTKDKDHFAMYPQGKCILPRGAVLHFTGAPETMKREDVNDALVALGAKIEFLDYQTGRKERWARLSYKYEARIIIKKMIDKKKFNIAGAELNFTVLSGKDEKRYHKKAIEAIYQLQKKAKGLGKKLKKAGYSYVTKYDTDSY